MNDEGRRYPLFVLLSLLAISPPAAAAATAQRSQPVPAETVFASLGVGPGGTVCEIGAGDGALSIALASMLGDTGRVYASELGERKLKELRAGVTASGSTRITVVAAG